MNATAFKASLADTTPPDVSAPLAGLWWAAKGDWDKAHNTVQNDQGREAAWVHAYLHRAEGDLPNAGYWYRTAGRAVATGPLDDEWNAMLAALLT